MLFLIAFLYLWAAVTIYSAIITSYRISPLDVVLIIFWPLIIPVAIVILLVEWLRK